MINNKDDQGAKETTFTFPDRSSGTPPLEAEKSKGMFIYQQKIPPKDHGVRFLAFSIIKLQSNPTSKSLCVDVPI